MYVAPLNMQCVATGFTSAIVLYDNDGDDDDSDDPPKPTYNGVVASTLYMICKNIADTIVQAWQRMTAGRTSALSPTLVN